MTAEFTPWTLFIDMGIVSVLILVGKLMRVKIALIQKLFIPPCLLAGFMGLALGPNGLGLIPLSGNTSVYASILIAFVFGSLPLTSQKTKISGDVVARMWAYSQAGMLLQWALGAMLGLYLLSRAWPLDGSFGIAMPCGFCGGHGSAAAVGQAFGNMGREDMLSLAMTAATFGIVCSVIIGLLIIKWGTSHGHTAFLTDYGDLPDELRTGLVPKDKRESMGSGSLSSISLDPLTFNLIVVVMTALGGYCVSKGVSQLFPGLELPVFSCAFVVGMLVKTVFDHTRVSDYVCPQMVGHISGTFTDLLVTFGIASIKLSVVVTYITPLLILLVTGMLATLAYVMWVARKMMSDYWFEKALFTWGWFTGTVAMGIALLRVVDPKMQSRCMDGYAMAYLFIAPVEISLITFAPIAFLNGYGPLFAAVCLGGGLAVLAVALLKGWLAKK